jgi:hypothetical protein
MVVLARRCPNIWYMVVLARNYITIGENFSSGRLLDPGIWTALKDTEQTPGILSIL